MELKDSALIKKGYIMSEPISREEHKENLDLVHKRIDKHSDSLLQVQMAVSKIQASSESIMTMVKSTAELVDSIGNELYGTKNGIGMKGRVIATETRQKIVFGVLTTIVTSILGIAFWIMKSKLT